VTRSSTINAGMFTSDADDWATPQDFFDGLDAEFNFTLDPCAYPHTAKCPQFFTKDDDGLAQDWHGAVFMNPPYGRVIGHWVRKAYLAAQTTADVVVCLIPARTCSRYWHDYCMKAAEIRFVKGRLRFGCQQSDKQDNAPFPNAVIVFRKGDHSPRVSTIERFPALAEAA
jgi:phage N-6-adenine-methyltransferase